LSPFSTPPGCAFGSGHPLLKISAATATITSSKISDAIATENRKQFATFYSSSNLSFRLENTKFFSQKQELSRCKVAQSERQPFQEM